jgi:hypothetical protein
MTSTVRIKLTCMPFCSFFISKAHAYTDVNAKARGVSIGVFPTSTLKNDGEVGVGPSQPYVDLMGRKVFIHLLHIFLHPPGLSIRIRS